MRWQSEGNDIQRAILLPVLLLMVVSFFLYNAIIYFTINNFVSVFNLILATFIEIYLIGRIYGEMNVQKDYVEVTQEGINFRETPGFGMGWLPRNGMITFDAVGHVDLIEIQSFLQPEKKSKAILLRTKSNKRLIIASKLGEEQKINILLALRGSVTLSSAIQKILGSNPEVGDTIKQVADFAKNVWKRYKENN